jgi:CO/xanthine dehydrogenase FAD-binding subunit
VNGPVRAPQAEAALNGSACDSRALDEAADAVRRSVEPNNDLHASPELRHRVLATLLRRACTAAWARCATEAA